MPPLNTNQNPVNGLGEEVDLEAPNTQVLPIQPAASSPASPQTPLTINDIAPEAPQAPPASLLRYNRRALVTTVAAVAVIVLIGLASWFVSSLLGGQKNDQGGVSNSENFAVGPLSLKDVQAGSGLSVGQADRLAVNGRLEVSNSLVLTPQTTPAAPIAGQIYFDQANKAPYYYNGSQFISLAPTLLPQYVSSIGGVSGPISVGNGLQITGNQLALSGAAPGGGVTSLQGQTGDVTLAAGAGISISGTTISSTGVLGTGSTGAIALFTGSQTLGSSVLSQSGSDLLASGGLTVTGAISTNSIQQAAAGDVNISAGTDNLVFTAGGRTFVFPTTGPASQTICTTGISCASGGGQAVLLQPGSLQSDTGSGSSIAINNTGGGVLLQLQGSGVDKFVVNNNGNTTIGGTLTVQGSSITVGTALVQGSVILNAGNGQTSSLRAINSLGQNTVYTLPDPGGASDTICLQSLANCVGTGGGVTTSGGTTNRIAKFSGANSIADSALTDTGSALTYSGSTVTFSGLSAGVVHANGLGTLSVSSVALGSETSGDYVANLGTLTGLSTSGNSGAGSTPSLSVLYGASANTAAQGNTALTFTGTGNLTGTVSGTAGGGISSNTLAIVNSPTFSGSLTVQGAGGVTIGVGGTTTGALKLANSANTNLGTVQIASLGQATTYTLPDPGGSTATICLNTGNCAGTGGGVTASGSGGTVGTIPLFDGAYSLTDSLLTQSGSVVSLTGTLNATYLQGDGSAITNLNASNLASGTVANGRLSGSYTGVTGTGALAAGSITTGFGTISTGNNITTTATLQGGALNVGSGAFAVNGSGAVTAATGITSSGTITFSGLNSAGVVHTNGSGVLSTGPVVLGTDTSGNYVASIGALTGLSNSGTTGVGAVPALSVLYGSTANTAVQGNTTLTCASGTGNLSGGGNSVTLGAGGSCNAITITNSPTFSGTLAVQGAGGITAGVASSTTGSLKLANAGSSFLGTLQVASLGQATTYTLPDPGGSTATICLDTGNCAGTGGGITGSGTPGALAKFNGTGSITSSTLSEAGSTVTASGNVVIQGNTSLTLGTASTNTGSIAFKNSANSNTVTLQAGASGSNFSLTLPTTGGSNGDCLQSAGSGVLVFAACTGGPGGGVTSLDGLSGVLTLNNSSGSGSAITIDDAAADGATKGIAAFNSANFTDNGAGVINTIQGIATTDSPTFDDLTLTGLLNGATISGGTLSGGTFSGGSVSGGSLSASAVNGLSVASGVITSPTITGTVTGSSSPTITGFGTYNGQTISSAANFTGTVTVQGSGGLTLGVASSATGSLKLANAGSSFLGTVQVASLSQATTYTLPDPGGASDIICLQTLANCAGPGGGVTSLDGLSGVLTLNNSSGSGSAITIDDAAADGATKGIAAFNSANFTDNGAGVINTIQGIATTSTPTFGGLTLTSQLTVANGGTGATSFNANGILFGSGTSAIQATTAAANSVLVTNGSNVPSLSQTLPSAVQTNITAVGTLTGGINIASGQTYKVNGTQISSANLSNDSNLAKLNGTGPQTFTGNNKFTGTVLAQNASTTGFQVQNGSNNEVLTVDTSGNRVLLGKASTLTGALAFANSAGANLITLQGPAANPGGNYSLTIPTLTGNDTICVATLSNCTASGAAGGDLTGSYPNPTIASLQGTTLTLSSLTSGDVLQYSGSAIVNGHITNTNLTAGTFGNITGTGALVAGSITTGFGTISTGNNITTTAALQGGTATITAANGLTLGTASSNTGGIVFKGSGGVGTLTLAGPTTPNAGNYTLSLPAIGANATVCTTDSVCTGYAPSAANGYVQLAPGTVQGDSTTNSSIFINKTGASGNILELQKAASDVFTIDNTGNITATGTYNSNTFTSTALTFGGANPTISASTTNTGLTLQANGTGTLTLNTGGAGTINLGTANSTTIGIGNTTAATAVTIKGGTGSGAISLQSGTGGTIGIGNDAVPNTIQIGAVSGISGENVYIQGNTVQVGTSNSTNTTTLTFTGTQAAGNITYTLDRTVSTGTYAICTTASVCTGYAPSATNGYVQLAPSGVQADSSTNNSIFINKTGASGNILELQKAASDVFTIGNTGNITATGTYNTNTFNSNTLQFGAAGTATVDSASGQALQIGTGANAHNITVGNSTGSTALSLQSGTGGINLGTTGVANTIQIGNTSGAVTQTINIGNNSTGSSTNNVNIGSSVAGTTTIRGATIQQTVTAGSVTIQNLTSNNTAAFQVQNVAGASVLTADTSNLRVNTGGDTNVGANFGNRLFSDNFESGNLANWWDTTNFCINGAISNSVVHDGNYSLRNQAAGGESCVDVAFDSARTTMYARYWVYISSSTTNVSLSSFGLTGPGSNVDFYFKNSTNQICANDVNSTNDVCGGTFSKSAWHEVKFRVTAATSTTGTTQAWLDGTQVLNYSNRNNGTAGFGYVNFGDWYGGQTFTSYTDDVSVDTVDPGTASSLNVQDSFHVGGTTSFGNSVLLRPTSDTATAFQIQNAAGTTNVLTADTANLRVTTGGDLNVGIIQGKRLFSDSFESGSYSLWSGGVTGAAPTIDSSTVHSGRYAAKITATGSDSYVTTTLASGNTVYARGWVNLSSHSSDLNIFEASVANSSTSVNALYWQGGTGKLCIWNVFAGSNAGCTVAAVSTGTWHLVEMRTTVATSSTGVITLWVDGSQIFTVTNANNGTTPLAQFSLGAGPGSNSSNNGTFYADDLSIDTSDPGTASSLNVQDSLHVGGTTSFGNSVLIQPASNSTTTFQVQNASGSPMFVVDAVDNAIGIFGDWQGNEYSRSTDNQNTTTTINDGSDGYLMYNLTNNKTSGNNSTTVTYNMNGFGTPTDGQFVFIRLNVSHNGGIGASAQSCANVKINGGTNLFTANICDTAGSSSSSAFKTITAARIGGSWVAVAGSVTGGQGADFAEWIPFAGDTQPQPGEVLAINDSGAAVSLANNPYDSHVIGVVSTNPYEVAGNDDGHSVVIALTGRVPVKVSLENGPIAPGDPLTASSTPGVAMKATGKGQIIGRALTGYNGIGEAVIDVQLHPGYNDPSGSSNDIQGNASISGNLNIAGNLTVDGDLSVAGSIAAGTLSVSGNAQVSGDLAVTGLTQVMDLRVAGHIITSSGQPVPSVQTAAGSGATITIDGNDTTGTLTITTGTTPTAGDLANIIFSQLYGAAPHIVISASNDQASNLRVYKGVTDANGFMLATSQPPNANTTYVFDYFIAQ